MRLEDEKYDLEYIVKKKDFEVRIKTEIDTRKKIMLQL